MSKSIKVIIEENDRAITTVECTVAMIMTGTPIDDMNIHVNAFARGATCPSETAQMVGDLVHLLLNGGDMSQETRDKLREEMKEELEKAFRTEAAK